MTTTDLSTSPFYATAAHDPDDHELVHRILDGDAEAVETLVNPEASCRCRNKVKMLVDSGAYPPEAQVYADEEAPTVGDLVGQTVTRFNEEFLETFHLS